MLDSHLDSNLLALEHETQTAAKVGSRRFPVHQHLHDYPSHHQSFGSENFSGHFCVGVGGILAANRSRGGGSHGLTHRIPFSVHRKGFGRQRTEILLVVEKIFAVLLEAIQLRTGPGPFFA